MATILRLISRSNRDTVLVLRALLANAMDGKFGDLALCYRDQDGSDHWVFTGIYEVRPAEVVNAAARITWRLSERQECS